MDCGASLICSVPSEVWNTSDPGPRMRCKSGGRDTAMTITDVPIADVDIRLVPERQTRRQFHQQIARLERELAGTIARLHPRRRPVSTSTAHAGARLLDAAELEAARDALAARLQYARDLVAHQTADRREARSLLKRMIEAPEAHRWARVTTVDLGIEGCRQWQSEPRFGPIGMLGNWWRVRMSSGCP